MHTRTIFFTLLACFLFSITYPLFGHNKTSTNRSYFIENKGQWHPNVLFRYDFKGGQLFLEKSAFTYHLVDLTNILLYHEGKKKVGVDIKSENEKIVGHAYQIKWLNTNSNAQILTGKAEKPYYNYYLGKKNHQTAVKSFSEIVYRNFYNHIDLIFKEENNLLKYDIIAQPFAELSVLQFDVLGASNVQLADNVLIIKTQLGHIEEYIPKAYQIINGQKVDVTCGFTLKNKTVSFKLQNYNPKYPLVIDPVVVFSTFSGSTSLNFGYTATFDSQGFLYSGSTVFGASGTYPTTLGAYQTTFKGGSGFAGGVDIAITKYDTTGTSLIYSTFIGGTLDELPHSLYVNTRDELYLFGTTGSENYPVTANAFDTLFNIGQMPVDMLNNNGLGVLYPLSCDLIISRFSNDGTQLIASTYLGGNENDGINNPNNLRYNYADEVRGEIEIDNEDNVYIASCTQSANFPVSPNAFQPIKGDGQDGVIVKLSPDLSTVIWSSFYGGNNNDALYSLTLGNNGNIYVAGGTESTNLPSNTLPFFLNYGGGRSDGFVGKISGNGSLLLASTYVGTAEYDQVYFIESDRRNQVYLLGQTESQGLAFVVNLDQTIAPYIDYNAGQFVMKLNQDLDSLHWSTRFGKDNATRPNANPNISPTAFLVDLCNAMYISGWGGATNQSPYLANNAGTTDSLPITTSTAFQTTTDGSDFYILVLSDDAQSINYASFFGGNLSSEHVDGGTSRFDRKGKIYQCVCAGCGGNSDFPIFPANAYASTNGSSCNSAVFKMDFLLPLVVADFVIPEKVCAPHVLQPQNQSLEQSATQYLWIWPNGDTSTYKSPQYVLTNPGTYEIKLVLSDTNTCNLADTISRFITVQSDSNYILPNQLICKGDSLQIGISSSINYQYQWFPSNVSKPNLGLTFASPDTSTTYLLTVNNGVCIDSVYQLIEVDSVNVQTQADTVLCSNITNLQLTANPIQNPKIYWWSSNSNFTDTLNAVLLTEAYVNPINALQMYYFKAINQNNCEAIDSVLVTLSDLALQAQPDVHLCKGDSVWLSAKSLNQADSLSFNWSPASFILSSADSSAVLVSPIQNQQYFVQSSNNLGCIGVDTVLVTISQIDSSKLQLLASADTAFPGMEVTLEANFNSEFSFYWLNTDSVKLSSSSTYNIKPLTTSTYYGYLFDVKNINCKTLIPITVVVETVNCKEPHVFIPKAFTPNNDNLNDTWTALGKHLETIDLKLFNRWGNLVFETTTLGDSWDGNYNSAPAPEGVYYFQADLTCIDGQQLFLKGDVTLMR